MRNTGVYAGGVGAGSKLPFGMLITRERGREMKNSIIKALPVLAVFGATTGFSAPIAQNPLRLWITCSGTECTAAAHGGSGTYVDFEWTPNTFELYETANTSVVDASMDCGVPGDLASVGATVTDSNGARATHSTWVFCP